MFVSRFCGECRTKVLRAYALLVEEPEPVQEKGYVQALYAGIRRCLPDKHIHLQTRTEYISDLITRAEPELMGRLATEQQYRNEITVNCWKYPLAPKQNYINNIK